MSTEQKERHMKQAGEYIAALQERQEKAHDTTVKEKIAAVVRGLRDLRDIQYWFDSGEKELERLYERYMPYLLTILDNYLKLETSWNHEELARVKPRLMKTLGEFVDTLRVIGEILPQDEIDQAKAEAKAKKAKEELDRRYRLMYEESN